MPDALDRRHLSKNPNVWEFAANEKAPSQAETCKGAYCCHVRRFPAYRQGSAVWT